ncbi:MAG: hemerythrin domain-containing protein [Anaerolineae bacterium]
MDLFQTLKKEHQQVIGMMEDLQKSSGSSKQKEDKFNQLHMELSAHASAEEQVFYPELMHDEKSKHLALEAIEEHRHVVMILKELASSNKGEDQWQAKLKVMKDMVEHHVEEEEGQIFQAAEKVLNKSKLQQIGDKFQQVKEQQKQPMGAR